MVDSPKMALVLRNDWYPGFGPLPLTSYLQLYMITSQSILAGSTCRHMGSIRPGAFDSTMPLISSLKVLVWSNSPSSQISSIHESTSREWIKRRDILGEAFEVTCKESARLGRSWKCVYSVLDEIADPNPKLHHESLQTVLNHLNLDVIR